MSYCIDASHLLPYKPPRSKYLLGGYMKKHSVSSLALVFVLFALTGCGGGGGGGNGGTTFPQLNEACSGNAEISQMIQSQALIEINAHQFASMIRDKRNQLWVNTTSLQSTTIQTNASGQGITYTANQSSLLQAGTTAAGVAPQTDLLCATGKAVATGNGSGTIDTNEFSASIDGIGGGVRLSTQEEIQGWDTHVTFDSSGKLLTKAQNQSTATTTPDEWKIYENGDQLQKYVDELRGPVTKDGMVMSIDTHFYANAAGVLAMKLRIQATGAVSSQGISTTSTVAGNALMLMKAY